MTKELNDPELVYKGLLAMLAEEKRKGVTEKQAEAMLMKNIKGMTISQIIEIGKRAE